MKNIVNFIQFIRAVEPRDPERNLYLPIEKTLAMLEQYKFKGTFLIQYDAMLDGKYVSAIKNKGHDIGLWLEVVQPLCESVGIKWNGRYPWDWYNDVGFLIGYEPEQRKLLIDLAMKKFKETFGEYPKCVGSWHIDAVSFRYLDERYHITAACICRDQVGTDGYTLQGGYYNQAYYPCKSNMLCPAQNKENQINIPVFRMLGSDPVREYDRQACLTLEPAQAGKNPRWVDWFLSENFNGFGLSCQYTQVGQENSFGWDWVKDGLPYQFKKISQMQKSGTVEVMTLTEAGGYYKRSFDKTPASTQAFFSGFNEAVKSFWFNCAYFRENFMFENNTARFRDIYVFCERLKEKYLEKRCDVHTCEYRNLPIIDGYLYSADKKAGLYFIRENGITLWDDCTYDEENSMAYITLTGGNTVLKVGISQNGIAVTGNEEFYLAFMNISTQCNAPELTHYTAAYHDEKTLSFEFSGISYSLKLIYGTLTDDFKMLSSDKRLSFVFIS